MALSNRILWVGLMALLLWGSTTEAQGVSTDTGKGSHDAAASADGAENEQRPEGNPATARGDTASAGDGNESATDPGNTPEPADVADDSAHKNPDAGPDTAPDEAPGDEVANAAVDEVLKEAEALNETATASSADSPALTGEDGQSADNPLPEEDSNAGSRSAFQSGPCFGCGHNVPRAPTVPGAVVTQTTQTTDGRVKVVWGAARGFVQNGRHYYAVQVLRNGTVVTAHNAQSQRPEYSFSGLASGNYTFRLWACNISSSGDEACSGKIHNAGRVSLVRRRPSAVAAPVLEGTLTGLDGPAPTGRVSNGAVKVVMGNQDPEATRFRVQGRIKGGTWQLLTGLVSTGQIRTPLSVADGEWQFRYKACNDFDWSCSNWGPAAAPMTVFNRPSKPAFTAVPAHATGHAPLKWAGSQDVFYRLYQRREGGPWALAHDDIAFHRRPIVIAMPLHDAKSEGLMNRMIMVPRKHTQWKARLKRAATGLTDGNWQFRLKACKSVDWSCSDPVDSRLVTVRQKPLLLFRLAAAQSPGPVDVGFEPARLPRINTVLQYRRVGSSDWLSIAHDKAKGALTHHPGEGDFEYRMWGCNEFDWACSRPRVQTVAVRLPPKAPVIDSSATVSTGDYTLRWRWQGKGDEKDFFLVRVQEEGSLSVATYRVDSISQRQFLLDGLKNGRATLTVLACNDFKASCSPSTALTVTVRHRPASAPEVGAAPQNIYGNLPLQWTRPANGTRFQVQAKADGGAWQTVLTDVRDTASTVFVPGAGQWRFRVRACHDFDWACGDYSAVTPVVTAKGDPAWLQRSTVIGDAPIVRPAAPAHDATIGSLSGQAGVASGVATYGLPFNLVPGYPGFTPSLGLAYSSAAGNGPVGMGWQLQGVHAITRCGATLAQDGYVRAVALDGGDRLCLGGQRLVLASGQYGRVGAQYRTEDDQFLRVSQYGADISEDRDATWFRVDYANNILAYFGVNTNGRVRAEGEGQLSTAWLLQTRAQRIGGDRLRTVSYSYAHPTMGEVLLSDISYYGEVPRPGDDRPLMPRAGQGEARVVLTWEKRQDRRSTWAKGGKTRRSQRLHRVAVQYQGQAVRDYTLQYIYSQASGRSLLHKVQECRQGQCLAPTVFDWSSEAIQYRLEPLSFYEADGRKRTPFKDKRRIREVLPRRDTNRDGVRDWPGLYVNAEQGISGTHSLQLQHCNRSNGIRFNCPEGDFNQDGFIDVWRRKADGTLEVGITNGQGGLQRWLGTTVHLGAAPNNHQSIENISDLNGDGWPDLIVRHTENKRINLKAYFHSRNPRNPYYTAGVMLTHNRDLHGGDNVFTQWVVGDMDGNGTMDLVRARVIDIQRKRPKRLLAPQPGSIILLIPNREGTVTPVSWSLDPVSDDAHSAFEDINGDGLPDWIVVSDTITVRFNRGDRTWSDPVKIADWQSTDAFVYRTPTRQENLGGPSLGQHHVIEDIVEDGVEYHVPKHRNLWRFMDVDGDGTVEMLVPGEMLASGCTDEPIGPDSDKTCGDEFDRIRTYKSSEGTTRTTLVSQALNTSIYRYDALRLTEADNGTVQFTLEPTEVVGAAYHSAVVDAFGDGRNDLIFIYGNSDAIGTRVGTGKGAMAGRSHGTYINYNAGTGDANSPGTDLLKQVVNGLGASHRWEYRPLSSGIPSGGVPFYRTDDAYLDGQSGADRYFNFASSMHVVSAFFEDSGQGPARSQQTPMRQTRYAYRGAVYHAEGRGFQGFRTVIESHLHTPHTGASSGQSGEASAGQQTPGLRRVTHYHQVFPYAGKVDTVRTCVLVPNDAVCAKALSEQRYGYGQIKTVDYHDGQQSHSAYWAPTVQALETRYDLHSGRVLAEKRQFLGRAEPDRFGLDMPVPDGTVDRYGHVLIQTRVEDGQFGRQQRTTTSTWDLGHIADWWLDKKDREHIEIKALVNNRPGNNPAYDGALDRDHEVEEQVLEWDTGLRLPRRTRQVPSTGQGTLTTTTYHPSGLPASITQSDLDGGDSRQRRMTWSGPHAREVINALGHTETTAFDGATGELHQRTDANGIGERYTYDAFGRPVQVQADGVPPVFTALQACAGSCPAAGAVYARVTVSAGQPARHEYFDRLGRSLMTRVEGPFGQAIYQRSEWDFLGRTRFASVPSHAVDTRIGEHYTGYDVLGRPLGKVVNQAQGDLTITYEHRDHRTRIVAGDLDMARTYSGTGQLMATTDADGKQTRYAYNGLGQPMVIRDVKGDRITAYYNALGQKLWVKDPNMGQKHFTYTVHGELATETSANGHVTRLAYDALGRVTARTVDYADGRTVPEGRWRYDGAADGVGMDEAGALEAGGRACLGLPAAVITGTGQQRQTHYAYDALCRPVAETQSLDGRQYTTRTHYDGFYGRVKGMTYPGHLTVATVYNNTGYPVARINPATGYTYRRISATSAGGDWLRGALANEVLQVERGFSDASGQMLDSRIWKKGATTLQALAYTHYDVFGNLKQHHSTRWRDGLSTLSIEEYAHDRLHRLTTSRLRRADGTVDSIDYRYDAAGNLLHKGDFATDMVYGDSGRSRGQAGPNAVQRVRLLGGGERHYRYDASGNLVDDGLRQYHYNADNKPVRIALTGGRINPLLDTVDSPAGTLHLAYDANGERYRQTRQLGGKTSVTDYISAGFERETVTENGEVTVTWRHYIDDIAVTTETWVGTVPAAPKVGFMHRDHLGSMRLVLDNNGAVVSEHSFDPFGRPRKGNLEPKGLLQTLNDPLSKRGFTDHEHLDEAQLIHMNGRVYDYHLGRFLSVDPVIQAPGNSQSLNPYSYILNNPMAGTDPSGYIGFGHKRRVSVKRTGSNLRYSGTVTQVGNSFVVTAKTKSAVRALAQRVSNNLNSRGYNTSTYAIGSQQSKSGIDSSIADTTGESLVKEAGSRSNQMNEEVSQTSSIPLNPPDDLSSEMDGIGENDTLPVTHDGFKYLGKDKEGIDTFQTTSSKQGGYSIGKFNDNIITPAGLIAGHIERKTEITKRRWSNKYRNHGKIWDNARLIGNYGFMIGAIITAGTTIKDLANMRNKGFEDKVLRGVDGILDITAGAAAFFGPIGWGVAAAYYGADWLSGGNLAEYIYKSIVGRREEEVPIRDK